MTDVVVVDTWKVIDRWWTDKPTVIWWREIKRDGKKVVQRHRRGERWTDVETGVQQPA
jgi:hypothetical protein